ncbi:unnamed protein product [Phyllotreta striolata]|uniref:Uncharacterized protein n=1 Tax=Phyllotreta striolata TaxID=444603 RepID=A0A9N9TV33_PHYSR|nr:unnamed protein product [Phyllotreta striolata]
MDNLNNLEYYKTLVSDDEVINALIKDSKVREGVWEKPRVRPNIQFLQRTLNNIASSNKRVSEKRERIKEIEKGRNDVSKYKPKKIIPKKKLPIEYIREILQNRIEFVKPEDDNAQKIETSLIPERSRRKSLDQKITPLTQIRDILKKNCKGTVQDVILISDSDSDSSDSEKT